MPSRTTLSPNDLRRPVAEIAGVEGVVFMVRRSSSLDASSSVGARPMRMSPTEVRARTSTVASDGAGPSAVPRVLRTAAEPGDDVQPRGGAFADADLELAGRGLEHDRAPADLRDPDVAVRRLGGHRRVRATDGDVAVRRLHPQVAGDLADRGVAVGVLDHRRAVDLADADVAGSGRDLRVAHDAIDGDVPVGGGGLQRAGLVEADVAHRGLEPALAELAVGGEVAERRVRR